MEGRLKRTRIIGLLTGNEATETMRLCSKVKNRNLGKVKHYYGAPPEITGETKSQIPIPVADVLLIEKTDSGIFLFYLTKEARCLTDSWHQTVEDAKEQAKFEFDNDPSEWKEVPDSYGDLDIVKLALGSDLPKQ